MGHWLAAYLVVLQAVLTGLAAGAMAAPGVGDAFTLCLSATPDGGEGADHGGTAPAQIFHDCNACPLAGGTPVLLDIPTAGPPQSHPIAQTTIVPLTRAAAPVPLFESARPRAPPLQG